MFVSNQNCRRRKSMYRPSVILPVTSASRCIAAANVRYSVFATCRRASVVYVGLTRAHTLSGPRNRLNSAPNRRRFWNRICRLARRADGGSKRLVGFSTVHTHISSTADRFDIISGVGFSSGHEVFYGR